MQRLALQWQRHFAHCFTQWCFTEFAQPGKCRHGRGWYYRLGENDALGVMAIFDFAQQAIGIGHSQSMLL